MKSALLLFAAGAALLSSAAAGADEQPSYPKKDTPEAAVMRGHIVFKHYCVLCHGESGEGNGRAAKVHTPPPANLTTTDKNDQYKELIIRKGGLFLGRSDGMPPWENELTNEQIGDVIAYLRTIHVPPKSK
jgi:mono/diheme cytochrome c family protein